jgi:hypothetical protein
LEGADVIAVFEEAVGEGVSQYMRGDGVGQVGKASGDGSALNGAFVHVVAADFAGLDADAGTRGGE